jgi:penicillin-binding protein 1A
MKMWLTGRRKGRGKGKRVEPHFGPRAPDLRADPEERLLASRSTKRRAQREADHLAEQDAAPRRKAGRKSDKPPRRRSLIGRLAYWSLVAGVWGTIGLTALFAYHASRLPPIDQLAVPKRPPNIAILSVDGALLANRGDTGGAAVHLAELPAYTPKAFIAIEDRRFYSHWGLDPLGILRAIARNVTRRGGMEGGSTLTQQLAKNLFLTQERTLSRKIQEAILALWLEHKYSKDQIIELYLNRVYFGSGAYGIEAAANRYFGHSARTITLSESAMLAGLMKAPSKLAPNRNPSAAAERASQVITAMAQERFVTEKMAQIALANPASAVHDHGAASVNYAADYIMDALDDTIGAIDRDIVVSTTLDPAVQSAAEKALTEELDKKGQKFGVTQGAIVALDPDGAVRALIGGRNYSESQFNRAVAAKRQPGSAFKPFVYLTALETGLTPDTLRTDGPINIKGWQPENYSHEYFGLVSLTKALALSLNTVAVRLGLEVGPKAVATTAHRLGIASELQANASIALGTSEVTPLELVTAYAPFANGGVAVQPHMILKVRTADGKLLYQRKGASNGRIVEPQYVAMMNTMMQETLLTGTARKAELPGWQAAGKTGTSQDFRDAWFVGYTSHLVAGVWLGNDDNSATKHVSGGNLPVEIWSRLMREAHKGVAVAALPSGTWRAPPLPPAMPPGLDMLQSLLPGSPAREQAPAPVAAARPQGSADNYPAPINLDQAAQAAARYPLPTASVPPTRRRDALLPPEDIPGADASAEHRYPPREPSFFEKLFGG